jgi:hypothetical protein
MFVGVLVYADDIVLLTPTPNAMRELLTICDDFSSEFDVTFNSMKSKCLYFHAKTAKKTDATLPDFFIGGNHIEFVAQHVLTLACLCCHHKPLLCNSKHNERNI